MHPSVGDNGPRIGVNISLTTRIRNQLDTETAAIGSKNV